MGYDYRGMVGQMWQVVVHVRSACENGSLGKGFYFDMVKIDLVHGGWMIIKCFLDRGDMAMASYILMHSLL